MAHSYRINYQHLMFHVAHMELKPDDIAPVHQLIEGVLRDLGVRDIVVGGVANHVHILANFHSLDPSVCIHRCKLRSNYWLKRRDERYRQYFHWQGGFSGFSVSYSNVPDVKRYVLDQFRHHLKQSAQDELASLVRKSGGYPLE